LKPRTRDSGQILIAAALLIPVLLGMSALAVDLGSYAAERRSLQNSADAMALAAAQDLPDATAAQSTAQSWATKNGIALSAITVAVSGGDVDPQVSVSISKSHAFSFIGALGVGPQNVGASAVAAKYSPGGIGGLMPWAITQDTVDSTSPGALVTIKYDAGNGTTGNYGAIDIDGNGANTYRDTIEHGATGVVCSTAMANCTTADCPGSYPGTCGENAASCDGPECDSETGNMVGPTDTGVQYRIDHTSAACDSFSDVFTAPTAFDGIQSGPELAVARFGAGGRLLSPPAAPQPKQPTDTPTPAPTNTPVPPTSTPAPPHKHAGPDEHAGRTHADQLARSHVDAALRVKRQVQAQPRLQPLVRRRVPATRQRRSLQPARDRHSDRRSVRQRQEVSHRPGIRPPLAREQLKR
jgi:Flp pilus assembly protein TadG